MENNDNKLNNGSSPEPEGQDNTARLQDSAADENTELIPSEAVNTDKIQADTTEGTTEKDTENIIPAGHPVEIVKYDYLENNYPFYSEKDRKLFNSARAKAVKLLVRCERSDAYLEKLIDTEIRNSELSDLDKALLNELTHGVIRWLRRLDWFLNGFYRGQYEKCLSDVKNAMRVALYQILFLTKIPYSAAVNEAVEFIKKIRGDRHAGVVNGLLRTIIRTLDSLVWPTREIDEVNYLGIIQSHPNWMVRRWVSRFGFDDAEKLCAANNEKPGVTVRINRTRITGADFENYLKEKGLEFTKSRYFSNYYVLKYFPRIYEDEFFKNGNFTVQDESAAMAGYLTDPKEGELILDVCAAPGGKSSHISELINHNAKIIAVDKYTKKVESMKRNFERLGLSNILAFQEDLNEPKTELFREKLEGKADKVLADVPCSGLGVIRKKPDIKWKRNSEDILQLQKVQMEILDRASAYVKPGGVLVYSTCTTEQEENSDVVRMFLESRNDFEPEDARKYLPHNLVNANGYAEVFPHIHGIDGAFSARLIRKF